MDTIFGQLTPPRSRPLALQIGSNEVLLLAGDVNALVTGTTALIDGMERSHRDSDQPGIADTLQTHLAELEALRGILATAAGSLADPPLELTQQQANNLRQVLADLAGYQRGNLTQALRELRHALSIPG